MSDIKASFPEVNERAEPEDQMDTGYSWGKMIQKHWLSAQNYLRFLAGRVRTSLTRKGEIKMATDFFTEQFKKH